MAVHQQAVHTNIKNQFQTYTKLSESKVALEAKNTERMCHESRVREARSTATSDVLQKRMREADKELQEHRRIRSKLEVDVATAQAMVQCLTESRAVDNEKHCKMLNAMTN